MVQSKSKAKSRFAPAGSSEEAEEDENPVSRNFMSLPHVNSVIHFMLLLRVDIEIQVPLSFVHAMVSVDL